MNMATMKELREECAKLGITPGRSLAECERRIAEHRAARDAAVHGTGIMQVTTPGNAKHVAFAEFAKADDTADDTATEPTTPEEEQAMAEYSAEMRRMDAMGEAAWTAEQFKPRMSRLMRMLADTTAVCGTLARNPLIYGGDPQRHDYAIMGGWQQVLMMQGRALARGLVARRR